MRRLPTPRQPGRRALSLLAALALLMTGAAPAGAVLMRTGDTLVVAFDVPEEPVLETFPRPLPGTGPLADVLRVGIAIETGAPTSPASARFLVELFRGNTLLGSFDRRLGIPGDSLHFTDTGSAFTFGLGQSITIVAPGLSNLARAGETGTVRLTMFDEPAVLLDVRVRQLDFGRGQAENAIAGYAPDGVIRSQTLLAATPVPAPAALVLLAFGALGLFAVRRATLAPRAT
ncbi:MAG: hypothetical protein MUF65_03375 [Rubritepida sp.]|nr:hypothetical protein [Rubritepida sp.]